MTAPTVTIGKFCFSRQGGLDENRAVRAITAANCPESVANFCRRSCHHRPIPDTRATVNSQPASRPFLRLFSALCPPDSDTQPDDHDRKPMIAGKISADRSTRSESQHDNMIAGTVNPKRVEVSLAEIAPVLADAINHRRGWLSDFSDDTVSIDADLYEVLLAYQQMRRMNAA